MMPRFVFHAAWSVAKNDGWGLVVLPMLMVTKNAHALRFTFMWLGALVVFSIHLGEDMAKGTVRVPVESKAGRRLVKANGAQIVNSRPALSAEQFAWNQMMERNKAAKGK